MTAKLTTLELRGKILDRRSYRMAVRKCKCLHAATFLA